MLLALLAFVAWTALLLLAIGAARVVKVLRGEVQPNEFPSGVPHGSDGYWRLNRAHANCLEFLPLFAAVVLTAEVADVAAGLAGLAWLVVGARLGQSLAHLSSGSSLAVNVRFGFFAVQVVTLIALGVQVAWRL